MTAPLRERAGGTLPPAAGTGFAPTPDWLRAVLPSLLEDPAGDAEAEGGEGAVPLRESGVLVPVVMSDPPTILLTKRSDRLRHHAGQVSFPGGRVDPADRDAEHAALREAEEEIALDPAACEVVGRLPRRRTGTGFVITPVVALVRPDAVWRASPEEVDEILFLPVADLLDHAAATWERRLIGDAWYGTWVWRHPRHRIWGATAHVLMTLAERLRAAAARPPG